MIGYHTVLVFNGKILDSIDCIYFTHKNYSCHISPCLIAKSSVVRCIHINIQYPVLLMNPVHIPLKG